MFPCKVNIQRHTYEYITHPPREDRQINGSDLKSDCDDSVKKKEAY